MTEFTEEKLAELRAVAEEATDGPWEYQPTILGVRNTTISAGVSLEHAAYVSVAHAMEQNANHIATFDPPTVLALIAALEAKTAEVEGYKQRFPCDGGCSYGDGPQEECSRHGRNPRDLWEVIGGLARERDEARAALERVREAVTEVANQESNRDRTHYESCWRHHLHCLAAKIIYETGADDATQP